MTEERIRRPDYASGPLTDDERRQMEAISEEWEQLALRTTPIEPNIVTPAIKDLYKAADLKAPIVAYAPSPLGMALAFGAAAAQWYLKKNPDVEVERADDKDRERFLPYLEITQQCLGEKFYPDGMPHGFWDFAIRCARRWSFVYQGGCYWAGTEAYLCAARDVLGLRLEEHKKYAFWEQCARHSPFRVMHDEFCIVSDFPEILEVDDEKRPHSEVGPSHRWSDGWELYHWHGVDVPKEWIMDKESVTPQIALTEENLERRRAACEIVGWHNILERLNARVIDEDEDPQVGTLLEVELPDVGTERFLRVQCGTLREFALPVPPDMQTALSANAWTFQVDDDIIRNLQIRT